MQDQFIQYSVATVSRSMFFFCFRLKRWRTEGCWASNCLYMRKSPRLHMRGIPCLYMRTCGMCTMDVCTREWLSWSSHNVFPQMVVEPFLRAISSNMAEGVVSRVGIAGCDVGCHGTEPCHCWLPWRSSPECHCWV